MDSRAEAHEAIAAGLVTVDGAPALKPATQVHAGQAISLLAPPRRYVSRGGEKLAHALEVFELEVAGRRCLDAGVSTGGFTDCLLQAGAASVVAYDVGYGQVHERLRADPRVEVHERTNVRHLTPDQIPPPRPDVLVADLSFIALSLVLPILLALVRPGAPGSVGPEMPGSVGPASDSEPTNDAVVLVKPQFEAQRVEVGKGGVVRDPTVWDACLRRVAAAATDAGWSVAAGTASPLLGPAGNVEFLLHLRAASGPVTLADVPIEHAVAAGYAVRAKA